MNDLCEGGDLREGDQWPLAFNGENGEFWYAEYITLARSNIDADAIPREIHDRLITAVREIYELLAINTADSINAAYLRAKEECEKCS
jgi:hypothetical protein